MTSKPTRSATMLAHVLERDVDGEHRELALEAARRLRILMEDLHRIQKGASIEAGPIPSVC